MIYLAKQTTLPPNKIYFFLLADSLNLRQTKLFLIPSSPLLSIKLFHDSVFSPP